VGRSARRGTKDYGLGDFLEPNLPFHCNLLQFQQECLHGGQRMSMRMWFDNNYLRIVRHYPSMAIEMLYLRVHR